MSESLFDQPGIRIPALSVRFHDWADQSSAPGDIPVRSQSAKFPQDANSIPDAPVPGARHWHPRPITELTAAGRNVRVLKPLPNRRPLSRELVPSLGSCPSAPNTSPPNHCPKLDYRGPVLPAD